MMTESRRKKSLLKGSCSFLGLTWGGGHSAHGPFRRPSRTDPETEQKEPGRPLPCNPLRSKHPCLCQRPPQPPCLAAGLARSRRGPGTDSQ